MRVLEGAATQTGQKLRVLIGCEESQVVCQAFRNVGHGAYSCDIQPTRGNPEWHYQCDIMAHLRTVPDKFYDLIILHPDCTAMAVCGNKTYANGTPLYHKRLEAIDWTIKLWNFAKQSGKRVALENPASVIFPHLREIGAVIQYIQPYQFGHMEQKKTGLALYNLPELVEENNVYEEMMKLPKNERERIHYMAPSDTRKRDRSVTYQGIANAFVNQWGCL